MTSACTARESICIVDMNRAIAAHPHSTDRLSVRVVKGRNECLYTARFVVHLSDSGGLEGTSLPVRVRRGRCTSANAQLWCDHLSLQNNYIPDRPYVLLHRGRDDNEDSVAINIFLTVSMHTLASFGPVRCNVVERDGNVSSISVNAGPHVGIFALNNDNCKEEEEEKLTDDILERLGLCDDCTTTSDTETSSDSDTWFDSE
jgi:hypothetical protein